MCSSFIQVGLLLGIVRLRYRILRCLLDGDLIRERLNIRIISRIRLERIGEWMDMFGLEDQRKRMLRIMDMESVGY